MDPVMRMQNTHTSKVSRFHSILLCINDTTVMKSLLTFALDALRYVILNSLCTQVYAMCRKKREKNKRYMYLHISN